MIFRDGAGEKSEPDSITRNIERTYIIIIIHMCISILCILSIKIPIEQQAIFSFIYEWLLPALNSNHFPYSW